MTSTTSAAELSDEDLLLAITVGWAALTEHKRWHAYFIASRAISHLRSKLDLFSLVWLFLSLVVEVALA